MQSCCTYTSVLRSPCPCHGHRHSQRVRETVREGGRKQQRQTVFDIITSLLDYKCIHNAIVCSALLCFGVVCVIFSFHRKWHAGIASHGMHRAKKPKKMQFWFIVCQKLFDTKLELHKLYLDELKWHIRIRIKLCECGGNKKKTKNAA